MTSSIPGLEIFPNFITPAQETYLLNLVDQSTWDESMKRRVQHYGYRYSYKARRADASTYLGELPLPLQKLASTLPRCTQTPTQAIVNEYLPGQGISAHIDCKPCFGPQIYSLSLGAPTVMKWTHPHNPTQEIHVAPRSLMLFEGDARSTWKHAIPARKKDHGIPRQRRVSITFRTLALSPTP